ncbi:MAG: phosphatidylserine decarboxylase [Deltaproteobacteria bacterium]|nr:MAG: phosphatidylserine decarboxylase [Deltaproteobacteria bacterium]
MLEKVKEKLLRQAALSFQKIPTRFISRQWGRFTRSAASRPLIKPFARLSGAVTTEAEKPLDQYRTLNEFFTRRLREGMRTVDPTPESVISPADSRVSEWGTCTDGIMLQVKGRQYTLYELLRDKRQADRLEGGPYITLYLSPPDYHWVHAPCDMKITGIGYMPGELLPVNPPSVESVPGLYTRNERVMIYAEGPCGPLVLVMVGACCVGSIKLTFHNLHTNTYGAGPMRMNFERPPVVGKGQPVGVFEMGSTVVLIFSPGGVELSPPPLGTAVRMGQVIGNLAKKEREELQPREERR